MWRLSLSSMPLLTPRARRRRNPPARPRLSKAPRPDLTVLLLRPPELHLPKIKPPLQRIMAPPRPRAEGREAVTVDSRVAAWVVRRPVAWAAHATGSRAGP